MYSSGLRRLGVVKLSSLVRTLISISVQFRARLSTTKRLSPIRGYHKCTPTFLHHLVPDAKDTVNSVNKVGTITYNPSQTANMDVLQVCILPHDLGVANLCQRLAGLLDRPLFPWKKLIVGFSIAQYLFEGFLSLRQYQVLKQTRPPKVLQKEVSQEVFDKSQARQHLSPEVHWC